MKNILILITLITMLSSLTLALDNQESVLEIIDENSEVQEYLEENQESLQVILDLDTTDLSEEELIILQKEAIVSNPDLVMAEFNQGSSLPSIISRMIEGERATVKFDGDFSIGLVFSDGKVVEAVEGEISNPSLTIYINDNVLKDMNQENLNLESSISNGDITFSGVGFWSKMKVGTVNIILKVFSWIK